MESWIRIIFKEIYGLRFESRTFKLQDSDWIQYKVFGAVFNNKNWLPSYLFYLNRASVRAGGTGGMPPVNFWWRVAPPVLKSSPWTQVSIFAFQKCMQLEIQSALHCWMVLHMLKLLSKPKSMAMKILGRGVTIILLYWATRPEKTLTEALFT